MGTSFSSPLKQQFPVFPAQRLLTEERKAPGIPEGSRSIASVHRELAAWTPSICISACAALLQNPTTFFINLYTNETGTLVSKHGRELPSLPFIRTHRILFLPQVCSCCLVPLTSRFVPGAQVFATCTAGDGGNALVSYKTTLSKQKHGVKPGKRLFYTAVVKSVDETAVVSGLVLTVQLPAGVTVRKSVTSGNFELLGKTHKGGTTKPRYGSGAPLRAVLNTTTVPATITWQGLVLPPGKRILFVISTRVAATVRPPTRLTFTTSLYQQLPLNGLPYCATTGVNQTVEVKGKGGGWKGKKIGGWRAPN